MLKRLAHRWRQYMTVGVMLQLQDVRAEQDLLRDNLTAKLDAMRGELAAARDEMEMYRLGLEALKTTQAESTRELAQSMEGALATLLAH